MQLQFMVMIVMQLQFMVIMVMQLQFFVMDTDGQVQLSVSLARLFMVIAMSVRMRACV